MGQAPLVPPTQNETTAGPSRKDPGQVSKLLKYVRQLECKDFTSTGEIDKVVYCLDNLCDTFEAMDLEDEMKINVSSYLLNRTAKDWWRSVRGIMRLSLEMVSEETSWNKILLQTKFKYQVAVDNFFGGRYDL